MNDAATLAQCNGSKAVNLRRRQGERGVLALDQTLNRGWRWRGSGRAGGPRMSEPFPTPQAGCYTESSIRVVEALAACPHSDTDWRNILGQNYLGPY
jgi:hypothetical protein